MRDYRLLIFDWDGTLADSIGRIVTAMQGATQSCGLAPLPDEAVKGIIGLGLPEAVRVLYPYERDERLLMRLQAAYGVHYMRLEESPSALFSGVAQALSAWREQGYLLAVATGKTRRGLQRVLEAQGWLDYFDITRCADETASKPDPRMLHEIMSCCGIAAEQSLMVGDSIFDLQMARNAGIDSVAVGFGAQSLEVLRAHGPALAINDYSEMRAWLARCSSSLGVAEHVG